VVAVVAAADGLRSLTFRAKLRLGVGPGDSGLAGDQAAQFFRLGAAELARDEGFKLVADGMIVVHIRGASGRGAKVQVRERLGKLPRLAM
jgi:hypothetical protein